MPPHAAIIHPSQTIVQRKTQRFGWLPDLPDARDHLFSADGQVLAALPRRVDLSRHCPPVYTQGHLGACTANVLAAAIEFDQRKQGWAEVFTPSRLFIYYNERVIENSVGSDSGAMMRDGIKSIAHYGACPESLWPYDLAKFKRRPSVRCYTVARRHRAVRYKKIPRNLAQMKGCLAASYPFAFGFTAHASIESSAVARSGEVPMPTAGDRPVGGHAALAVGYDDARQVFFARNSWGPKWGRRGYFTIPYLYLHEAQLASDFWTVRLVQ